MKKLFFFLILTFGLYQGAFATTIPTSGLIGRWNLTSNAIDTSVTALTGTTAYPSYYTGVTFGSEGAVFNGTNGKIFVSTHNPSSYQLSTSQSFSISAWIKTNSVTDSAYYLDNRIFQLNSYTNNIEGNIGFGVSAGKIKTFFRDSNGNLLNPVSTASVNDGLWNQVTLVYDGGTKTLSIYINGNFDNSQTNSSMNGVFGGGSLWTDYADGRNYPTTIGFGQNGSDVGFFDGNIQQVLVYSRAITAYEVQDIMLAPLGGSSSTSPYSSASGTFCYDSQVTSSGHTYTSFAYPNIDDELTDTSYIIRSATGSFFNDSVLFTFYMRGSLDAHPGIYLHDLFRTPASYTGSNPYIESREPEALSLYRDPQIIITTVGEGNEGSTNTPGTGSYTTANRFNYMKLTGTSNQSFKVEYDAIEYDFDGKEMVTRKTLANTFRVNGTLYVDLPFYTRKAILTFDPGKYFLTDFEIGSSTPLTSIVRECVNVTPEDINTASGLANASAGLSTALGLGAYSGSFQSQITDTGSTNLKDMLLNKVKYFMGFLSFTLSENGNQFSVYLPIGQNLALSGVALTIPKTGFSPNNTGALAYFAPVTVGNNKTVVDYIIFIGGVLLYLTGVFSVVYFLVFFFGIYLFKFIYSISSSVSFGIFQNDNVGSRSILSIAFLFVFYGLLLFVVNLFFGNFLSNLAGILETFRNVFGYTINYFVLSFTGFGPTAFVTIVNVLSVAFLPLVVALLLYRMAK